MQRSWTIKPEKKKTTHYD